MSWPGLQYSDRQSPSLPHLPSHHLKDPTLQPHIPFLCHEPLLGCSLCPYSLPSSVRLRLTCLLIVSLILSCPQAVPHACSPCLCSVFFTQGKHFLLYREHSVLVFLPTRQWTPWGQELCLSFLCILGDCVVPGLKEAFVFNAWTCSSITLLFPLWLTWDLAQIHMASAKLWDRESVAWAPFHLSILSLFLVSLRFLLTVPNSFTLKFCLPI